MTKVSVLHVVESYGGGVASAVRTYARTSAAAEHHLFCRVREGELAAEKDDELFASITTMPIGTRDAIKALRATVRRLAPDVVHAHSSLGGALTRLAIARNSRRRIIYTPHCYAFERLDLKAAQRFVFRMAETVMAWNTSVVAACSPRELSLARKLRPNQLAVHVPNIPTQAVWAPGVEEIPPHLRRSLRYKIVVVGRIAPQKDPDFLINVAQMLRSRLPVEITWVGSGEPSAESRLTSAGIEVTGWINLSESAALLRSADLLIHTASWEAMPIVFLEANACSLPMVVRRTASMPWLSQAQSAWSEGEVAKLAERVLTDSACRAANRNAWKETFREHTSARQGSILEQIYRGKI